ncbi:fungal-specific transcription factor domain-containing protein [Exophiala viscosa]|uniref:Fungal-specific transcription factor domain-containing protein n=1 Tax=Exophiala viscosa TaxID=2486360 RepID=A0AAN6E4N9_9EURO|nr:fungal-specific transcription factor domain-containing protein [Exophiala viscosa]
MASGRQPSRSDPVCDTCRRKCRKCDRTRPYCNRCTTKGLVCEGYSLQFKVYDKTTGPKKPQAKPRVRALSIEANSTTCTTPASRPRRSSALSSPISNAAPSNSPLQISPASSSQSQLLVGSPFSSPNHSAQLNDLLSDEQTQNLLVHFDVALCDILSTLSTEHPNPFRMYILPLAYQHAGLLHAILGLSACHLRSSEIDSSQTTHTAAIHHKLLAIQSLGALLLKEECFGLNDIEEELALAVVLILVLDDICDSGKSLHGAHLNGVAFLCSRIVANPTGHSPFKTFLVAALAWLDILRGFTGAEKLAFAPSVRKWVVDADDFSLETVVGCPVELFYAIGTVLEAGKAYLAKELPVESFEQVLHETENDLRLWDSDQPSYPTSDPSWRLLAHAYRHACILRVLRFPNTFATPCTDSRVRESVDNILEACAQVPWSSPLYKKMLFPLFMAGADTTIKHQQHYVKICIAEIQHITGFPQPAVMAILQTVWHERTAAETSSSAPVNVPWMEYTCSSSLQRQHDYLFF